MADELSTLRALDIYWSEPIPTESIGRSCVAFAKPSQEPCGARSVQPWGAHGRKERRARTGAGGCQSATGTMRGGTSANARWMRRSIAGSEVPPSMSRMARTWCRERS
jgi:hypothetical protein